MGGGGSPQQASTTTTSSISNPWAGLQRPLIEAEGLARGVVNSPQSQFPYTWQQPYSSLLAMAQQNMPFDMPSGAQEGLMAYPDPYGGKYGSSQPGASIYQGPATGLASTGTSSPYGVYTPYQSQVAPPGGVTQNQFTQYGSYGSPASTNPADYQTYPGGYYQNFMTGQTMPYTNYLPYVSEVAPFNPYQTEALQQTAQIAMQGDPLAAGATTMLSDTLAGKYLSPSTNPYLGATYQAAAQPVMENYLNAVYPSIRSAAAQAGQFGSSSDQLAQGQAEYGLGQSLQSLGTGIYGGNYQAERANQLKASLEAPAISAEAFTYPQALLGAGTIAQQQSQQQLNDLVQQWSNKANYPMTMLQDYVSSLAGLPISGGTQTGVTHGTAQNPYYVSTGQQLLGGASTGLGMAGGAASLLMALGLI